MSLAPATPTLLLADGKPLDTNIATQAAEWFACLQSPPVTDADRQAWQAWINTHPDHARAWAHIEHATARFTALPGALAFNTLNASALQRRRRAIKSLLSLFVIAGSSAWIAREQGWLSGNSAYITATGQQQEWILADGTHVFANTDTAFDVSFTTTARRIILRRGDILVTTGHTRTPYSHLDLIVETSEGQLQPLGTRFTVSNQNKYIHSTVFEGRVAIATNSSSPQYLTLESGQSATFSRHGFSPVTNGDENQTAWIEGQLVADDMRLQDFMALLSRYRPGFISCGSDVANLRISGLFPVHNTDNILHAVASLLPVKITMLTRYWVRIDAV